MVALFYKQTKIFDKLSRAKSKGGFLISSFISSYSFSILFIKRNSSWLIFELIKALKINTSVLFNLDFDNNTVIDLYCLIRAAIAPIFNPIRELKKIKTKMCQNIKVFNIISSCTNLFVLFSHQFILFYFFKEIISCFIYVF